MTNRSGYKTLTILAKVLPLVFLLAACGKQNASSSTSSPSIDPGSTPTPGAQSANMTVSISGFPSSATTYMHIDGDWTKPCQVSPTDAVVGNPATNRIITCDFEVAELDLWYSEGKGFSINYNVPAGMCDYYVYSPYWFYQYAPGSANGTYQYKVDQTGAITLENNMGGLVTYNAATNSAPICKYDYSNIPNGPNCCEGNYTKIVRTTNDGGATYTSTSSTGSWPGKWGNCAKSGAVDPSAAPPIPRESLHNYPVSLIADTLNGSNPSMNITSAYTHQLASSIWTANFMTGANPTAITGPGGVPAGNRYYTFFCLDHAYEAKAIISLQVRRWTLMTELAKKSAGNPNSGGFPTFTNDPVTGLAYDFYYNWDDLTNAPLSLTYPGANM